MVDRSKKVTELNALTNATGDDLLIIVDSPAANAETKKITVSNFVANVQANAVFKQNVTISGDLFTGAVHERFTLFTGSTGTVVHNCANGHYFLHNNPVSNFTANFTNLNLQNGFSTDIGVVINQNGTSGAIDGIQIDGVTQAIRWYNGISHVANPNSSDRYNIRIVNNNNTYSVLCKVEEYPA